jgi:tetraacyldisaccharide-1-P 4'-kinase
VDRARELAEAVAAVSSTPVLGCAHLRPDAWLSLAGRSASAPRGDVLVVSAVARPAGVEAAVREALRSGARVESLAFADHHAYSEADLATIRRAAAGRTLVVTEKDAVKLERLETGSLHVRVLGSAIDWDWGEEAVVDALARAVRDAPA